MSIPATGYDSFSHTNNTGGSVNYVFFIPLSIMSATFKTNFNSSDKGRGRAAKNDGTTELATDFIDIDDTANTGWVVVNWGALADSATATIRLFPPNTANSIYAVGDTYGQHAAYPSSFKGVYPLSADANDRTSNVAHGTAQGGVTIGGITGQAGAATQMDGNDDWIECPALLPASTSDFSIIWLYKGTDTAGTYLGQGDSAASLPRFLNRHVSGFFSAGSDGFIDITTSDDIDDTWRMLSVTDSDLYIDGSSIGSGTISFQTGTYDNFGIASFSRNSGQEAFNSGAFQYGIVVDTNLGDSFMSELFDEFFNAGTFWTTPTWTSPGGSVPVMMNYYRRMRS